MIYDPIDPPHYNGCKIQHKDVVMDWGLSYFLGCATKYIARNGHKAGEDPVIGLQKAQQYINFEIERLQSREVVADSPAQMTARMPNPHQWPDKLEEAKPACKLPSMSAPTGEGCEQVACASCGD